jgi:hypothetical protein
MSLNTLLLLFALSVPGQDTRNVEIDLVDVNQSLLKHFGEKIKSARNTDELVAESLENLTVKLVAKRAAITIKTAEVVVFEVQAGKPSILIKTPPGTIDEVQATVKSVCTAAEVDNSVFLDWQTSKAFKVGDAAKKSFRQGTAAITVEIRRSFNDDKPWVVFVTLGTRSPN